MSEQKQRNYINGIWLNEKSFSDGGSIIKLSILPEKFIDSIKGLKVDENGFARVVISKSKTPKPNSTHFAYEDDFVPQSQNKSQIIPTKPVTKPKKIEKVVEQDEELI